MNKWQKTDIIANVKNKPFITLTESKITNVWYHDELDTLFCLTALGFKGIIGSKRKLFELNLQRMKNVHILPTDKLSRLRIGDNGNFVFGLMQSAIVSKNDFYTNQHIYITSDEEIKEGDWFIHSSHGTTTLLKCKSINSKEIIDNEGKTCWLEYSHKIILTTDQDLIKDNVQAIDDEFLEWFVKNPSCEEVKVEKENICARCYSNDVNDCYSAKECSDGKFDKIKYKIIIPKEEPTEEAKQRAKNYMSLKRALKPKQETLEEVIKQYCLQKYGQGCYPDIEKGIEFGAKWQQEQDKNKYSEEEVHNIITSYKNNKPKVFLKVFYNEWFEQFKKK